MIGARIRSSGAPHWKAAPAGWILGATAAMVEDERLLGVVMHIGYQLQ